MRSNRTISYHAVAGIPRPEVIDPEMKLFAEKFGYDLAYPALKSLSRNDKFILTGIQGYIHVLKNNLWGLCRKNGEEVVPCQYEDIDFVYETAAMVAMPYKMNGKWGLYSILRKSEVLPCIYDNIYLDKTRFIDSVVCVLNGKEGLFHCGGLSWDIPLKYNSLRPTGDYGIPYPAMIAEIDGKFGIVKSNEEKILLPIEYDNIYKDHYIYYAKKGDDLMPLSEQDYPDIYRKEIRLRYFGHY